MFDNDNRPDVPALVGFVVVVALAGGVIVAATGGIINQPQEAALTEGDSIGAGATPNETVTSPTPTATSTATPTSSTDGEEPTETTETSGSDSSVSAESDASTPTTTPTETESSGGSGETEDTSSDSNGSSDLEGSTDGSDDSSSSSTESTGSSGDDGDTETATATPTATPTETATADTTETPTPTETSESDGPDGDLGLFECEEDTADGSSSCQIRLTAEPDRTGPSWEYDMPVTDNFAHWLLSYDGVFGVQFDTDGDDPVMVVFYGDGVAPDLPTYTANGIESRMILTDAMPGHGPPPEGYEWEPLPDRSYDYGLEISDSAARTVLSHDDVVGVRAGYKGGVVFYVTSEEFAEQAPEEIEGHSMEYSVVEDVSAPDQ